MASGKQAFYHNRSFQLLVGGGVTVACLAYAWWDISSDEGGENAWEKMRLAFRNADYRWLPAMLLAILLFYWIKAWRWTLLLHPIKPCGVGQVTPAMMIGFAFNNLLPAHLGDLVRVFVFARSQGVTKTGVLSTVALERVLDVLAILVLMGIGLATVKMPNDNLRTAAWIVAGVAGTGVVCALIYLFWTKPFVDFVESILGRIKFLPAGFSKKVAGLMEAGATGLASLKDPKLVVWLIVSSLAQWLLNAVLVHMALMSFRLDVSPLVSLIVMGVVAFGVTIPSSPGYFGVLQVAFKASAGLFVAEDLHPAVYASSVYYHLVQWIPVTLVGLIFFQRSGLSMAAVDEEASHLADDPAIGGAEKTGETGDFAARNPV